MTCPRCRGAHDAVDHDAGEGDPDPVEVVELGGDLGTASTMLATSDGWGVATR